MGEETALTELDETPDPITIETQETYPDQLLPDNQLGMESSPGHDSGDAEEQEQQCRSALLNQIQLVDSDDENEPPAPTGLNDNFKNKTPKKEPSQLKSLALIYEIYSVSTCLH